MPAFLAPMAMLAAPAAWAAGKGLLGVGAGYTSSRIAGRDYDLLRDGALDFGLGAATLPGTSGVLRSTRIGGRLLGNPSRVRMAKIAGGSLIPFGGQAVPEEPGMIINPWRVEPPRPVQGPVRRLPHQVSSAGSSLPEVTAVPVSFTERQAPTFNKTLADYLRDKDLNRQVGQQIFQTNVPLLAANKQEKVNRGRKVNTNKQLGASLQKEYAKTIAAQKAAHEADALRAKNRAELLKQQTADAEAQVPITYLEGEAAKAKGEAGSMMANEQSMADALVDRLAAQGQQYLEQLKLAEASQNRANEQAINNAASDAIRANAAQIRANQAQRGTLLGTLAAEQYKNAIDLHNLNVQNFNNGEDRRFQLAVKDAELKNAANMANAELGATTIKELAKSKSKGNKKAEERGSSRLLALQKKLDTARHKMVEDPRNNTKQVKYSSTDAGKAEIASLRKRIATIKKRYGTGPV